MAYARRSTRPRPSRGPRASCPSASGRSTSTASTRTSASSSRSSSRCCSTATSRRGEHVLDPFGGSGHDARAGARVGARRDRRRHRRLQLPPHARQDGAVRPAGLGEELRDAYGAHRGSRGAARGREPLHARLVRPRAADELLPSALWSPGTGTPTSSASSSHVQPLGAPHDPLRPRGATRATDGRVLVPQASPALPAGGVGASASSVATRSTHSPESRSSRRLRDVDRRRPSARGRTGARPGERSTPSSRRRRIRG